jgi:hypothetical protein
LTSEPQVTGDESRSEVRVSVESQTDEAEEVFDHAQQLVDAAAPFKLAAGGLPRRRNDGHHSTTQARPLAPKRTRS